MSNNEISNNGMGKKEVIQMLEPLISEAERSGKWLRCTYQGITFSPAELRKENAEGNFCWGPVNWQLIDPKSLLVDVKKATANAEAHNENLRRRGVKK